MIIKGIFTVLLVDVMSMHLCAGKIVTTEEHNSLMDKFLSSDEHKESTNIAKKLLPAVVLIHIFDDNKKDDKKIYNAAVNDGQEKHYHSVISGTIIHPLGYVVTTCDTLVEGARIIVSINSEDRKNAVNSNMIITKDDYEAKIIKKIPNLNVAVLKIDKKDETDFAYANLSNIGTAMNKKNLMLNKCSFAIGKALGEKSFSDSEYVSKKNSFHTSALPVETIFMERIDGIWFAIARNSVMTACVILPENAGGAIIDNSGRVVGIIDYKSSKKQLFAKNIIIPANVVKKALGLASVPAINVLNKKEFGATFKDNKDKKGVYVDTVQKDSLADQSGIFQGDTIMKLNEESVDDSKSLKNMLDRASGDGTTILTILRNKKIIEIEIMGW
ncbi:MAG: S1C family serine protease [Holosporales bacterium]|jgi:S1-C subfamily serine protease|nr:S1C family serine protease [Holosporales bacterium]